MEVKLYHIPNIVFGIKPLNGKLKLFVTHISIRYYGEGSLDIKSIPLSEYYRNKYSDILLIEGTDQKFDQFKQLSEDSTLNCMRYSYSDLELLGDVDDDEVYNLVFEKFNDILETNLKQVFKESIEIVGVEIHR